MKLEADIASDKYEVQLEMQRRAKKAQLKPRDAQRDVNDMAERSDAERLQLFEGFLDELQNVIWDGFTRWRCIISVRHEST